MKYEITKVENGQFEKIGEARTLADGRRMVKANFKGWWNSRKTFRMENGTEVLVTEIPRK